MFISNALSPAQVASIRIDEERNISTVVVPDKQLSLAIGKEGQNARLAAKLTGWRINIKSVSAIETEKAVEVIPPEVTAGEPLEAELEEEIEVEESVEFPSIPEAPPEKPEEKQIRFAEDILMGASKAAVPDKIKSGITSKRKKKVIKYKKQDDHLIDDEIEE